MFKISSKGGTSFNKKALQKTVQKVWSKTFPYMVLTSFLLMLVLLGIRGYNALYRSGLSQEELQSRTTIEEKKNQFKQEEFNLLLQDIEQREAQRTQRTRTVKDIFYQSSIVRTQKK